jgi:hypothetical protein
MVSKKTEEIVVSVTIGGSEATSFADKSTTIGC